MARRTNSEIENDYKRIRKVVDTKFVTSIKDIAEATNLSESEVKTSLSKHPRVEKNIFELLEKNKAEYKAKKKTKTGEETNIPDQETPKKNKTEGKHCKVGFVIDASICGIENLHDILSDIFTKNAKIILTSITIKELEKLQKSNDIDAKDARHILAIAAENQESFCTVLIDENLECPDDCIIKYCADHKDDVVLLTSDKTMTLKARMYGVTTQYYKHTNDSYYYKDQDLNYQVTTLLTAITIGDKLVINNLENDYRSILVISNDIEYSKGSYELKIGDDVYIASKKPQYMTFAHYHIISLTPENNCELVYSIRIHSASDIHNLPKAGYKTFMREFKRKHDL